MTPAEATALIAALGSGTVIPSIVRAISKSWSGRASAARERVDELVRARDRAEAARQRAENDRDHQAKWRRILQEYASSLRSLLIEHGVPASALPPVPSEPRRHDERNER